MSENLAEIWLVLVIAGMLWAPGFWSQKVYNRIGGDDYSVESKTVWTYLIGVYPGQKVYLRPASVQIIGLLYLLVGLLAVGFYGVKDVLNLGAIAVLVGFGGCGFAWFIVDIVDRVVRSHMMK